MDYSDFKKLSEILRGDLRTARIAEAGKTACLFRMIESFQDYSVDYR